MKNPEPPRKRWLYTKRPDGKIAVTIDNNAWDFLCEHSIDLAAEFPADQFALFIPREVEIEGEKLRELDDKKSLRKFIDDAIAQANVQTAATFGFDTGQEPQRMAPLGYGTFQSDLEREIYEELRQFLGDEQTGSGLYENEGDAAVAVSSFFSIVVTCERPRKVGPLSFAAERGGRILFLHSLSDAARGLRQYVVSRYSQGESGG